MGQISEIGFQISDFSPIPNPHSSTLYSLLSTLYSLLSTLYSLLSIVANVGQLFPRIGSEIP